MTARSASPFLGWLGIFRLGLVQASIGALVVVTTSMLNRIQVVELALPAVLPGILVAIHYFVQVLRPRFGYGSDVGGRRTPWIIGGMAVLAAGALGATWATTLMPTDFTLGVTLAVVSFVVVGLGVGACGTSLLVLLSTSIAPARLAAAATVTWVMMIAGFIITTVVAGKLLEPFSLSRLVEVTAVVAAGAFLVTCLAVVGVERPRGAAGGAAAVAGAEPPVDFRAALREVWAEPHSRRLAGFVFVSMLAYSAQDLVLEPFAGTVFGLTPAQSTRLSGMQSGGVLVGMLLVAVICTAGARSRLGSLRGWTIAGCLGSAVMLVLLALAGMAADAAAATPTLRALVFMLGLANGAFAVAAIGSMMGLVGRGRGSREGTRMGLWGAAQAVAFGLGGIVATGAVDLARLATGSPAIAYGAVFVAEALLFVWATVYAVRLSREDTASTAIIVDGDALDPAAHEAAATGRS
ncbi:MAG: BCD family MFS transporter [Gammaproteobacteria bacterium]|jgi:BCD family chlorophyll transporter-like MFS transporter